MLYIVRQKQQSTSICDEAPRKILQVAEHSDVWSGTDLHKCRRETSKQVEVHVRAILRQAKADVAATRAAKEMGLRWSSLRITSFNDLEPPSVDFRGFNLSTSLQGSQEARSKYPSEVARRIARLLKDAGATGGNLASYLAPDAPDFPAPCLHYVKGNIQGLVIIQMGKTGEASEALFLVCYEHLRVKTENAEQD